MEIEIDSELVSDELLLSIKSIAKENENAFKNAITELFRLENSYRLVNDAISTGKILVCIVQLFYENRNFAELNENIIVLCNKKHMQSKLAIVELVKECCKYAEEIEDKEVKIKLLQTLRIVTEGKLYAEIERAQLSKDLARIKQEDGELREAIIILEDLKVDTLSVISKMERTEIIILIMELLVATKDYIKCLIMAKKISLKFFEQEDAELLKIRYYKLMITIEKTSNFLNTSRHYQAIIDTNFYKSKPKERLYLFALSIMYCLLAPFDSEQNDMMLRLSRHKLLDKTPNFRALLQEFIKNELIDWYLLKNEYKNELHTLEIFDQSSDGLKCWKDLRTRIIEHNIKIFSIYYSRINLSHISDLLYININETEKHLSNLIASQTVNAKIDRLTGIVEFNKGKAENGALLSWLENISNIMKLIDKTTHLINKELCSIAQSVHQVQNA